MVPFTFLRRLYKPNYTMFWMGVGFLLLSILYMYTYMGDPGFKDYNRDLIYYLYVFIFLFLLINIPNDIIRVFIPVVVLFTLVSNLGLVYSLITNPSWAIGQRATITLGNSDDGSGNPHVFSRNAFMGVIACAIWLVHPKTNTLFRLLSLFAGALSLAVLVLTQTRSSVVALILALAFFVYFNVRPAQVRAAIKNVLKPIPILFMVIGLLGIIYFFRRYYDAYAILYGYVVAFIERNLENVYAILGLKSNGAGYKAALDESAANRSLSANFFCLALGGHTHRLILGFGYKYLYLDVPVLEALTNLGLLGFILFAGINLKTLYYSVLAMRDNPNPLNTFLGYFYMLILVTSFTNGRPYEMSFWVPLALMIRFMGVDHLFPAYLSNHPSKTISDDYTVASKAQLA